MEDIKSSISAIGALVMFVVAVVVLGFVLNLAGLAQFSFFAPKVEQVRYNTFKESQAFNEGTVRELYSYQREYLAADDVHKAGIRSMILHTFSTYPKDRLPADLQAFYDQVQSDSLK